MYVSEKGLLVFDQLPWFTVAERLEREKEVMAEERAKFEAMLEEQQVGRAVRTRACGNAWRRGRRRASGCGHGG